VPVSVAASATSVACSVFELTADQVVSVRAKARLPNSMAVPT